MTVVDLTLALSQMPEEAEVQIAVWRNKPDGGRGILRIPIREVNLRPDGFVTVIAREEERNPSIF